MKQKCYLYMLAFTIYIFLDIAKYSIDTRGHVFMITTFFNPSFQL